MLLFVLAPFLLDPRAAADALQLHGFAQGAFAYRLIEPDACPPTQRPACEDDFVLGEERLRLEIAPRGNRWGLVAKGELIHDAIDNEVDGDLREGYLDLTFSALDLRVGRQVITWGVGDLIFINDVFPKDWAAFIPGLPLEYLKKGSDAVSATGHWAGTSLQVVLIPRFEADTVPEAGGRLRFHDPLGAVERRETDEPSPAIDHIETGLRLFRNLLGWDASLYAYRGFFHSPAEAVEPGPEVRLFFPPLDVYGASGQGTLLGGVVSLEAAYYDSRADRSGRDPSIQNSSFKFLAGYQRELLRDLTLGIQYAADFWQHEHAVMRGPGVPEAPTVRHVLTGRITQLLWYQTLRLGLFALGSPDEGDFYLTPEARYQVTDALSATLGINLFGGSHRTAFGQFEGDSNLYLVARYAF